MAFFYRHIIFLFYTHSLTHFSMGKNPEHTKLTPKKEISTPKLDKKYP